MPEWWWTFEHPLHLLHQDHQFLSSYHSGPTSRSHRRAKAALSHPWSLPKNAARYDSTDDVYDVRLGFLPKCIYSEKQKKTSLTFCQILWARWKIARYILVSGQNTKPICDHWRTSESLRHKPLQRLTPSLSNSSPRIRRTSIHRAENAKHKGEKAIHNSWHGESCPACFPCLFQTFLKQHVNISKTAEMFPVPKPIRNDDHTLDIKK